MRTRLVFAVLGLMSVSFPALATVAPAPPKVPGNWCNQLGATTMADDHKNLVACMCPDSGACVESGAGQNTVWKSMSGGTEWIHVPPGYSESNYYMLLTPMTPLAWCQQNGFSTFTGKCRDISTPKNSFYGPLVANDMPGGVSVSSLSGVWHWSCTFGNAAFGMAPTTEIECAN
ncbi:MAG: hypothetical protein PHY92_06160 [Alphaproteobacteria bacterium]|nr:hypothetical protein [Alphaproteobacteria bacterium]